MSEQDRYTHNTEDDIIIAANKAARYLIGLDRAGISTNAIRTRMVAIANDLLWAAIHEEHE